ncbi:MAG: EutN/CcmL family microcompartment protein [Oscillospiraceae bacterium]
MKIAIVIGSVWATRKDERLSPCKLLVVHTVNLQTGSFDGPPLVAVDRIGAGTGERVLLVEGSGARGAVPGNPPVDATVIGIVDDTAMELFEKETIHDV